MAHVIKMPLLSDSMTEGTVAVWHKKVGDVVKEGDIIAEIESDKATMDFESYFNGVLLYIGCEAGQALPIGQLLAIIGQAGEDISAHLNQGASTTSTSNETPKVEVAVEQHSASPVVAVETTVSQEDERVKASPLAKSIAKEMGIDLTTVKGSGENGRIIKRDVEQISTSKEVAKPVEVVATPTPVAQPQPVVTSVPAAGTYTDHSVSQMRKTIARRLTESKNGAPHFYLTIEMNMDRAMEVRKSLNELSPVKISYNDMIIKACALALRKHPAVNSSWLGDKIRENHVVNVGMAVAIEDGLIVPVIRNADQKGMATISEEAKKYAEKARNRELQPADWEGNTFTISNLGMFGIEEFTAIINPPDACILAVGGIMQKPVVKNGEIVVGNTMKVTLSCDHRVVDGATGASFLQTVKALLEEPMKMLI
ncbi:MAG: pyruvate dehydrogenase complex dihydrolipoamide acetyltransferase [Bacteroidia bacterium]